MYSLERLLHHHYRIKPGRKPTGFEALMANFMISQLAVGMMGMFGVLFVYGLGTSFHQSLVLVLVFFGLQRVVVGVSISGVARIIAKTGYRWMMLIGLIFLAIKAWLMMMVGSDNLWLLVPALVFGGVSIASYYLGYHGMFLDDNDDDKVGEQEGLLTMIGRLSLMVSPILGGWLVQSYGFEAMFGVAMSLLIVSLTPLFLMDHHKHKQSKFSEKEVFSWVFKKESFGWSVFFMQIESAVQAFYWPIFLFLIVENHLEFGAVASGAMVVSSVAVYLAGRAYDKRPLRRGYPLAMMIVGLSYGLRFTAGSMVGAMMADSLNRLSSPFWWMKIRRRALLQGEKVKSMVFAAGWEWVVTLGMLVGLVTGYLILRLTGGEWRWLILPAVMGVGLSGFLRGGRNE